MGNSLTINEALVWAKTLKDRHAELVSLRNQNSFETRTYLGQNADKEIIKSTLIIVSAIGAYGKCS
jgi:hypothetical protein